MCKLHIAHLQLTRIVYCRSSSSLYNDHLYIIFVVSPCSIGRERLSAHVPCSAAKEKNDNPHSTFSIFFFSLATINQPNNSLWGKMGSRRINKQQRQVNPIHSRLYRPLKSICITLRKYQHQQFVTICRTLLLAIKVLDPPSCSTGPLGQGLWVLEGVEAEEVLKKRS